MKGLCHSVTLLAPRDLSRLESLEVEDALESLVHMMAVTGCVLLIFLLAVLIIKAGLILTYPRTLDQHKDMEVRGASSSPLLFT